MLGRTIFFFASCYLISEAVECMYSIKQWEYWMLYLLPTAYLSYILFG